MNEIQIWQGPNGLALPPTVKEATDLVQYAYYLSAKQQNQIAAAFQIEAFDMAAEYAWKKAMVKLKETLSTLGMKFVGEMIGRDDFDEATSVDSEITDHIAIELAEKLGVIGATAALRLKHSNELITHYFSKNSDEELDYMTAFTIVKSSIQYILGERDISIAIEFSQFRTRLLNETLKIDDMQVVQVIESPLFYLRTVITILLSSIRNDVGAKLEHSIANLNLLIPEVWKKLGENDKWHLGTAYRDTTAAGNTVAAVGLKNALLKVNGFDYVPENLRSSTFNNAAKQVILTHFERNNFYNEPAVVKKLSNLGSTIPAPALVECMQAYLAVYLGNHYGTSNGAAPIAEQELSDLSRERWYYYFQKVIHTDDIILLKMNKSQVERFSNLLAKNNLNDFLDLPRNNQLLYSAIVNKQFIPASRIAERLYMFIKNKGKRNSK
jgi:hypothetical protein